MVEKKGTGPEDKPKKITITTGKRKRAVARAKFQEGSGTIKINRIPIDIINNEITRMKIREPLMIAGDGWKKFDISVNVKGGGMTGQADAARQSIAKGLAQLMGAETRKKFMEYDRYMLVADPRRTEPHKPPRSSQGPRRYKQRSKR
jgi:small subunit ribosomal protein S9